MIKDWFYRDTESRIRLSTRESLSRRTRTHFRLTHYIGYVTSFRVDEASRKFRRNTISNSIILSHSCLGDTPQILARELTTRASDDPPPISAEQLGRGVRRFNFAFAARARRRHFTRVPRAEKSRRRINARKKPVL